MCTHEEMVAMTIETYSRMVFAQGFLPDGQGIIEQMGGLFVFVLIPAGLRGRHDNVMRMNVSRSLDNICVERRATQPK